MKSRFALISLWDLMQIFQADKLLSLVRSLVNSLNVSQDDNAIIRVGWRQMVIRDFNALLIECDALELHIAADQTRSVLGVLEGTPMSGESGAMTRAINMIASTIEVELRRRLLFVVPPERAKYYTAQALFGDEVENNFSSISPEIAEAGKCYALGRYSAAVYHLMRTLEGGLRCLAKELSVPFENATWNAILDQIEKSIRGMSSATYGSTWKDSEQFYSEAAAHFRVLKNAWRNYTMHLKATYDDERAMEIYNSVRAFMRHLATRLQE